MRFSGPLLLLAAAAVAQEYARESIEMMPGLTREQRQALHSMLGKEGAWGAAGLTEEQTRRLLTMPRGPLREERYNHGVVLEVAPGLDRLVAATDAAQAALLAQRENLLRGLEDRTMRARIESASDEQRRAIERRFWRVAWYAMTPEQMRAARELFSPRYRQYADLQSQLPTLPGLAPSQLVRLRALFAELESENAADQAETRRIGARLRDPSVTPEERAELQRANGAAYGRMHERNEAFVQAVRGTLTKEQLDALHARPPLLNAGDLAQPPWELVREMRLSPEQTARLKALEEETAKARAELQRAERELGPMMAEIGPESPQMMAVETARQGARGRWTECLREAGRVVFTEILTPAQACDWVAAPGHAP